MTNPGVMVLTPYSGEVLLTAPMMSVQIEWCEWLDIRSKSAGIYYLAAEGWLECARGDLAIGGKVEDL